MHERRALHESRLSRSNIFEQRAPPGLQTQAKLRLAAPIFVSNLGRLLLWSGKPRHADWRCVLDFGEARLLIYLILAPILLVALAGFLWWLGRGNPPD
jgi:hypothetical protein